MTRGENRVVELFGKLYEWHFVEGRWTLYIISPELLKKKLMGSLP